MAQMPEEGKLFKQVDTNWKDVMRNTIRDPKVGGGRGREEGKKGGGEGGRRGKGERGRGEKGGGEEGRRGRGEEGKGGEGRRGRGKK